MPDRKDEPAVIMVCPKCRGDRFHLVIGGQKVNAKVTAYVCAACETAYPTNLRIEVEEDALALQ